jgi:hypothetical protein
MHEQAGATMSEAQKRYVGINEARDEWARAAFDILVRTASRFNGLIVYSDLAQQVQDETGLYTRASQRNWIGGVLGKVVRRCHAEGLPPLTALVVHKHDGQVGTGYDEVLLTAGLQPIHDQMEREQHAANARLDCYRRWCPNIPPNAKPALSPQMQAKATWHRRQTRPQERPPTCPRCFTEMARDGFCPQCAE